MDRTIIAPLEQMRDFDFVSFEHDVLVGLGALAQDLLSQLPTATVGGFIATQTSQPSLSIKVGVGRIYQLFTADAAPASSIGLDSTVIVQQGQNPGQTITLTPPSAGQSRWNLIQCQFSQVDAVRTGDPNGGIVPFYNASNPAQPTTQSINTVRQGLAVLQVITGAASTTGSEVPPTPTSGWLPLYLIDLVGGQTAITTAQILTAGPSVGTGVPANYPFAPFLAGLFGSHHNGNAGQAPKINLTNEVQGVLPYINMSPVRTLLNADLVLYVNPSTGSDVNKGLTPATAFRTPQAAVNSVYQAYDFNGFQPIINLAAGSYTTGVSVYGLPVGLNQGGAIQIIGNTGVPASVAFNTAGACFSVAAGSAMRLSGVSLLSNGNPVTANPLLGSALVASGGSILYFSQVIFQACTNTHMLAQNNGTIATIVGGSYTIAGGAVAHMIADVLGFISPAFTTATLTGTPAFSVAFAVSQRNSVIQVPSMIYSGAATGSRFACVQNAIITNTGGNVNFFPGSSAGTTNTGGQYS